MQLKEYSMSSVLDGNKHTFDDLPRGRRASHRGQLQRERPQLQQLERGRERQHRVLPPDGVFRKKDGRYFGGRLLFKIMSI